MPLLSRNSFIGLAKETTIGTYVAPTVYFPVGTNLKPEDVFDYVDDDSLFASPSRVRGVYQGEVDSTYDFDGPLYPEVIGHLMVAAGMADTTVSYRTVSDGVTTNSSAVITSATANWTQADVGAAIAGAAGIPAGTTILSVQSATSATMSANATAGGTALTFNIGTTGQTRHRFAVPAAGSQPPTYSITDYASGVDGSSARGWPGQILDSLDITISNKGMLKYAAKWKGWQSATQSKPTPAFPASAALLGWEVTAQIAALTVKRVQSVTLSWKKKADTIHTMQGTQQPYTSFSGEFDVSMKMTALMEDTTELLHLSSNDQPTVLLYVTTPSSGPIMQWAVNKAAWKKAPQSRAGTYLTLDMDIQPVHNATDGGMISAVLQNSTATAY